MDHKQITIGGQFITGYCITFLLIIFIKPISIESRFCYAVPNSKAPLDHSVNYDRKVVQMSHFVGLLYVFFTDIGHTSINRPTLLRQAPKPTRNGRNCVGFALN
jgi:hypothetical protein